MDHVSPMYVQPASFSRVPAGKAVLDPELPPGLPWKTPLEPANSGEEAGSLKRFCVWCGTRVPPKLVSARFCAFCGRVHSGEGDGAPSGRKPGQPKPPQARAAAAGTALEAEARQRVAAALVEQSAAIMAWSQSQAAALAFGDGHFGKDEAGISRAALYGSLADPVFLPVGGAKFSSEAWGEGSSLGPDLLEEGTDDSLWAHMWQRSLTSPAKIQSTTEAVTPAMLYQLQANNCWS